MVIETVVVVVEVVVVVGSFSYCLVSTVHFDAAADDDADQTTVVAQVTVCVAPSCGEIHHHRS